MNRVLHLEDSARDAELIADLLMTEWPGCVIERVTSREEFQRALECGAHDLILSDFSLPGFHGGAALDLAREVRPETPFIFMSGTIGEDRAIEALRRGAVDYVIKDRPDRLVAAIRRAFQYREEAAARRRSDEALRLSQERHRRLVEQARDAIFTLSETGEITALNTAFERITGWSKEQWLGRRFHDLIHPDDLAAAHSRFARSVAGEPNEVFELRVRTAAGGHVDIEFTTTPYVADLGITGIGRDVTERKEALVRLREQAEIIDRAPVAVFVSDLSHRLVYINDGALQLHGLKREEALGRPGEALFSAATMRHVVPARDATLEHGSWHGEVPVETLDGRQRIVEFFMSLIRDEQGRPRARLSLGIDITDRRMLETQLQRAARLDSIGMLAGGIAHDLNNVLAPIQIGVDLLRLGDVEPGAARTLDTMERSARHGADLVRQLMAFARGEEVERAETSMATLLDDVVYLLGRALPRSVRLAASVPPGLPPVLADGTQLKQVLVNLCINARDAMPQGGAISLTAEHEAPWVRLRVSDTGTGMSPAVREKIFEPFFTTKGRGKGTGLGLSNVRRIVEKHEGTITVESEEGSGTVFTICLPAFVPRAAQPGAGPAAGPRGRGELVLVVDADAALLTARRGVLEQHGYRTAGVSGLLATLDWLQQNRGQAKLALIAPAKLDADLVAFLQAVAALDPAVKVVTLSDATDSLRPGARPATLEALLELLRRAAAS